MSIIESLRRLLLSDDPDYSDMPDYKEICDRLGIDSEQDPILARNAINEALALMDLNDDLAGIDLGPADNDNEGGANDLQ